MKPKLHYQSIPASKPQPTRSDFAKAMGYLFVLFVLFLIPFICGFVDRLLEMLKNDKDATIVVALIANSIVALIFAWLYFRGKRKN